MKSFSNLSISAFFLTFFLLCAGTFSFVPPVRGAEFRPVSVYVRGECAEKHGIQNLFDANLSTYALLLDDSRTGKKADVLPPNGSAPVTAFFVLDLGEEREISGIRLTARNSWVNTMAQNVTIYACSDAEGEKDRRLLTEKKFLKEVNHSYSAFVEWPKTRTRFVAVQVNESYQKKYPNIAWWGHVWYGVLRNAKDDLAGEGKEFSVQIAEVSCFDSLPSDAPLRNPSDVPFPRERLFRDWIYQDCGLDVSRVFTSKTENALEKSIVQKVLSWPKFPTERKAELERTLARLESENVCGSDPRWKDLYAEACALRRNGRLAELRGRAESFIYVKHAVMDHYDNLVSDEQYKNPHNYDLRGSQLCLLKLNPDGSLTHEVLLEQPEGMICSPELSYDAKTLLFAMRSNFETDDFHIYRMDLETRRVTQVTFTPESGGRKYPCGERYACFLPSGEIMFASTRCTQINDCWPTQNSDLYVCEPDGSRIRRLTFDQLLTDRPLVLNDGRIIFSRWEYNDRNAYYLHPLFTMNQDGTTQTEFYGNNCTYPSALHFGRPIPGSQKLIVILGGHHSQVKGKLALLDRTKGTQGNAGIEFVAGAHPDRTPGRKQSDVKVKSLWDWEIDMFGQDGPQFNYPYAFDEEHYLCAFSPEGWIFRDGPYSPPFGSYYMTADGERELLAFDWYQSTGLMLPVIPREVPPVRISHTDQSSDWGLFYVQNVYLGPGLKGIKPGTVKKLRVAALEYRPAKMGQGWNHGESGNGISQTPPSFTNGSWDVKHVLGEVDVEEDGSCCFRVPARTPVYFQLLDEKGYCVQTMRSWATLQGGEQFACLGCHENKNDVLLTSQRTATLAMRKPVQDLQPAFGETHPFIERLKTQSGLDSAANYLGVNEVCELDPDAPVDGFSYRQDIQPILDRHCLRCHNENSEAKPDLSSRVVDWRPHVLNSSANYKRAFTQSYMALTHYCRQEKNPWMKWLDPRSRSEMLPPYHTGSAKSPIMNYLESSHYDVQVSENEKRKFACWIDLVIPFCGSHAEANTWTEAEKKEFGYFLEKRTFFAEEEIRVLKELQEEK